MHRDAYLGRIAAGRVSSGTLRVGDKFRVLRRKEVSEGDSGTPSSSFSSGAASASSDELPPETKVTRIFKRIGMERVAVDEAVAGDIVSIAGSDAGITDTLAGAGTLVALDPGHVDPPTLRYGAHLLIDPPCLLFLCNVPANFGEPRTAC